jgi:hypothetical protein
LASFPRFADGSLSAHLATAGRALETALRPGRVVLRGSKVSLPRRSVAVVFTSVIAFTDTPPLAAQAAEDGLSRRKGS